MKEKKFNIASWVMLQEFVKSKNRFPQVFEIEELIGVSNRVAYAYLFTLVNHEEVAIPLDVRKKLQTAERNLISSHRLNASLEAKVDDLQAQLDFMLAIEVLEASKTKFKISSVDMSKDENTAITCLSDVHVEETVVKEVVNHLNEYNVSISSKRIEFYFKRLLFLVESFKKGGWKINNLVLAILGDLITGYIHEELEESNSLSPVEATILIQDLLIAGITYLVNNFDFKTITIPCLRGNHGRTTKKKRFNTGYKNSFEWLMYNQLAKYFHNRPGYEHVKFLIPKSEFQTVQVYDKTWCFSHGDHFNYQGGVGGMMIPFKRWIYKMMQILPADKYAIGHWHTYFNLPDGMSNGSAIGYNAFAMGHGFSPEPPQQQFQLQDSRRGFTINTPIILTDWK